MKTLIVSDVPNWALDRCLKPLANAGLGDICYHYTIPLMDKHTGYNNDEKVHLTIDLLKNYDIIHLNSARNANQMLGSREIVDILKDKKIIFTVHNGREKEMTELLNQDRWRVVKNYICPTYSVQKNIQKIGFKTTYIPQAIEEDKFPFFDDYPRKNNIIGYIGRIIPHKRLKDLVTVSGGFKIMGCGYVDDGNYWRDIPKENLTFKEYVPENEKVEFLKQFTILASISTKYVETGPLGVLECASLGIPIVTTNQGWATDNLDENSAVFVKDDLSDLNDGVKKAILDADKLRKNAKDVMNKWKMSDYIEAYRKVFNG